MLQTAIAREKEQIRQETIQSLQTAIAREKEQIRQDAIQLGEAKGKRERNRQIVHAMTAENYPIDAIARLLDLSPEEVQILLSEKADE